MLSAKADRKTASPVEVGLLVSFKDTVNNAVITYLPRQIERGLPLILAQVSNTYREDGTP